MRSESNYDVIIMHVRIVQVHRVAFIEEMRLTAR